MSYSVHNCVRFVAIVLISFFVMGCKSKGGGGGGGPMGGGAGGGRPLGQGNCASCVQNPGGANHGFAGDIPETTFPIALGGTLPNAHFQPPPFVMGGFGANVQGNPPGNPGQQLSLGAAIEGTRPVAPPDGSARSVAGEVATTNAAASN